MKNKDPSIYLIAAYRDIIVPYVSASEDTLTTTLSALSNKILNHKWRSSPEEGFWATWRALIDIAQEIDEADSKQDKLVKLVDAIKEEKSFEEARWDMIGTKWFRVDLPQFGMTMRDAYNMVSADSGIPQWTNFNALMARLTSAGTSDMSIFAIWMLRDALEKSEEERQHDTLEGSLPAAVMWLKHCGATILDLVQAEKGFAKPENDPGWLGDLCKVAGVEKTGFSTQRWEFWRQRLREISKSHSDGAIAQLANDGLKAMSNVDPK